MTGRDRIKCLLMALAAAPLWGCSRTGLEGPVADGLDEPAVTDPACAVPGSGSLIWAQSFGGIDSQVGGQIALSPDESMWLAGEFEDQIEIGQGVLQAKTYEDVLVARLDASGQPLWGRRFGGGNDLFKGDAGSSALAVVPGGGAVIGGNFSGSIDFGEGAVVASSANVGGFIARLDAAGDAVWSKAWVAAGDVWVPDVRLDSAGNVIAIVSVREGSIDLGGGPVDGPVSVLVTYDVEGGYRRESVLGNASPIMVSDRAGNIYLDTGLRVVKLDPQGTEVWNVQEPAGPYGHDFRAIAVDARGDVFLAGDVVAKLDPEGQELWQYSYGNAIVGSAVVDGCGDVIVAGSYRSGDFGDGEVHALAQADLFILKLGASGERKWVQTGVPAGGATPAESHEQSYSDVNSANDLVLDSHDDVIVTGNFGHTIDLAGTKLSAPPQSDNHWPVYDIFVAKLSR